MYECKKSIKKIDLVLYVLHNETTTKLHQSSFQYSSFQQSIKMNANHSYISLFYKPHQENPIFSTENYLYTGQLYDDIFIDNQTLLVWEDFKEACIDLEKFIHHSYGYINKLYSKAYDGISGKHLHTFIYRTYKTALKQLENTQFRIINFDTNIERYNYDMVDAKNDIFEMANDALKAVANFIMNAGFIDDIWPIQFAIRTSIVHREPWRKVNQRWNYRPYEYVCPETKTYCSSVCYTCNHRVNEETGEKESESDFYDRLCSPTETRNFTSPTCYDGVACSDEEDGLDNEYSFMRISDGCGCGNSDYYEDAGRCVPFELDEVRIAIPCYE